MKSQELQSSPDPAPFSWYPGHMLKAEREIRKKLSLTDLILEVADARAPAATRNQKLIAKLHRKPRILVMTRCDLAETGQTNGWQRHLTANGLVTFQYDKFSRKSGVDIRSGISRYVHQLRMNQRRSNGHNRCIRAMIVGVPNAGKSTLINVLANRHKTSTGPRPGVTRGQQWIAIDDGFELLDTPGVLPPKIPDRTSGLLLAALAVVKEDLADEFEIVAYIVDQIRRCHPEALARRYRISCQSNDVSSLIHEIGITSGLLNRGGIVDISKVAKRVIKEFRDGKFGRITLESPP